MLLCWNIPSGGQTLRFFNFVLNVPTLDSANPTIPHVWLRPRVRNCGVQQFRTCGFVRACGIVDMEAWSPQPMEASPLGLRSALVLSRALLEVSSWGDSRRRRQQQTTNNNPACINSPLQTAPPGWFVNPFEDSLTPDIHHNGP